MKNKESLKRMTLHERERYFRGEYEALTDKYERLFADFQNYKRNKEIELESLKNTASKDVILGILDFYDTLKYAVDSHPDVTDSNNNIMYNKFKSVLNKCGAEMYCKEGDEFDENLHEAVYTANDQNFDKGVVVRIIKEGCKLNGHIIRYAQVIVNQ